MIYFLDTNVISDLLSLDQTVRQHLFDAKQQRATLALTQPVYYELMRGLLHRRASRKIRILQAAIISLLDFIALEDGDWLQAARFWAEAASKGRQLSDVDLLLAAMAQRRDAVVVSSDADFDGLPIQREDWRKP